MEKFYYWNPNPKKLHTDDCVIRAFSYFFGITWRKSFFDLIEWCADRGLVKFNFRSVYNKYLEEKGYLRHKAPFKGITVGRFRDEYAKEGKCYIISCKRHLTIIHDKALIDIGDCSDIEMDGYWLR